jgi:cytochrome c553
MENLAPEVTTLRSIVAAVVLCFAGFGSATAQPDVGAGERGYAVCAGCHGFGGEGNALVGAPRLAGLEPWYVAKQMQNFGGGIRGGAGNPDRQGFRMAVAAKAVRGDRERDDLVAYLATLPRTDSPVTVQGNLENGRQRYAACAACHGARGEGNATLASPALTGLDDWYVVRQLELFVDGARGAETADVYGQQMRALAALFPDDTARRDLAAYIKSLER